MLALGRRLGLALENKGICDKKSFVFLALDRSLASKCWKLLSLLLVSSSIASQDQPRKYPPKYLKKRLEKKK